ncbi:MAG: DUF1749 domain-containing protein [bacterium]
MKIVKTTTEDGLDYSGMLFTPDNPSENIIIHIHGMAGDIYSNSFYPAMHEDYPKNGWAFLVGEHRGTHSITQFNTKNGLKNIGNAYEMFEDCVFDIKAWIEKAKELGYRRIWLQSHSLGPSKVAYYMHKTNDPSIEGLIFLSPSDHMGNVNDELGINDHKICLKEAYELVEKGRGDQILSHNLWEIVNCPMKISAKSYVNSYGKDFNTAIFNYSNESLGWKIVNSINIPVIAFSGTNDDGIVTMTDANKAMGILERELINSPKKKTIVFEEANHDFEGFGNNITKEVLKFINE